MSSLRLVFAGSPPAAVPTLTTLASSGHELVRVITRPPTPQGRKRVVTATPVAHEAAALGIPVIEARRLDAVGDQLTPLDVDLGVIVAFGALVRAPLLTWPRLGWINLHFSLLPRWRGAAPVQHAIIAGDQRTGATVFQLTEGLDEGDWYAQLVTPIGASRTAGSLLDELSVSGAGLMSDVVQAIADGTAIARPQTGETTLAPKLERADAALRWNEPAEAVLARLRGVTPEPGAFTRWGDQVIKVIDAVIDRDSPTLPAGAIERSGGSVLAGTATSPLRLLRVQPAGKREMSADDWARGLPIDSTAGFS